MARETRDTPLAMEKKNNNFNFFPLGSQAGHGGGSGGGSGGGGSGGGGGGGNALFSPRQQAKKKRKSRTAFTNHQIFELEKRFLYQKYLSPADRDEVLLSSRAAH